APLQCCTRRSPATAGPETTNVAGHRTAAADLPAIPAPSPPAVTAVLFFPSPQSPAVRSPPVRRRWVIQTAAAMRSPPRTRCSYAPPPASPAANALRSGKSCPALLPVPSPTSASISPPPALPPHSAAQHTPSLLLSASA